MKNNLPDKQTNFLLYTGELEEKATTRKIRAVQTNGHVAYEKQTNKQINKKKTTSPAKQNSSLELFSNFVVFQTENGKVNIDVFFQNDTLWLTQKKIAELFEKDRTVIGRHLKNIFKEGELNENMVCVNFAHTTQHGAIKGKTQEKEVKYYNLRAITNE